VLEDAEFIRDLMNARVEKKQKATEGHWGP
jgi:hypothetical protein